MLRQVLDVLLRHGGNVDVVNDAEMTPLHYAGKMLTSAEIC